MMATSRQTATIHQRVSALRIEDRVKPVLDPRTRRRRGARSAGQFILDATWTRSARSGSSRGAPAVRPGMQDEYGPSGRFLDVDVRRSMIVRVNDYAQSVLDSRSANEIVGYGPKGLPS
jgi:hypothetical protein